MNYLTFSIIALVSYSLVAPLVKLAIERIPAEVAVVITNSILVLIALGWALSRGCSILPYINLEKHALYLYVAGIFLGVGILSYYLALGGGPVSVVVPVYGLFIALSSIWGFILLGEQITLTKIVGLFFAVLAIFLVSR